MLTYGEADPSIFANDGMGPLHAAAQAGEIKCLKWLVKHGGVSATQKAEDGATPMHFAAAGGQVNKNESFEGTLCKHSNIFLY